MKIIKRSPALTRFIIFLLLTCLCVGPLTSGNTMAQTGSAAKSKISPDLRERVRNARSGERVNVIIQSNGTWNRTLDSLLKNYGGRITRQFQNINPRVVNLPAGAVESLTTRSEVRYISLDRDIRSLGHISSTSGADAVRTQNSNSLLGSLTSTELDGTGIGIAVIDSGIDANHSSFLNKNGLNRVVTSHDFTGENRTDDPYGHGTHVASAVAGDGQASNGAYVGIAPNADIINLRVLGAQGSGLTSNLLSALDWVLTYRSVHNIRVVNMSIGTAAVDSYKNDPVCVAVRSLVDAGIVVVAAAGNLGKDSNNSKVYGRIHSPGSEPSAITVGASNTYGTDARNDDVITTFSSRGPTRSYWTDASSVKHYDNLVKPDIVAPGNTVIWAEALRNYIVTSHPELDAGVSSVDSKKMMYLSGTSMATPVVAAAAALLL